MSASWKTWGSKGGLAACCLWGILGVASAQEKAPQKEPPATTNSKATAPRASGHENMDAEFAACLVLDNQNEIVAAKIAEERSESSQVKKFAQMLRSDHEKFIADLEKFGGQHFKDRLSRQADARTEDRRSEIEARDNKQKENYGTTGTKRDTASAPTERWGSKHLQIRQEIADECLASARRELSDKQGAEFNACYVGMQIAAHMKMVSELKVLERHASRELKPVLHQGRTTAEEHLQQAKDLMKSLEKADRETAQRSK